MIGSLQRLNLRCFRMLLLSALVSEPHRALRAQVTITEGTITAESAPFSSIFAVRELSDGKVLATDGIENILIALDENLRRTRTIGRAGDGPGEYRAPGPLIAINDDSTILVDRRNRKWSVLDRISWAAPPEHLKRAQLRWQAYLAGVTSDGSLLEVRSHGTHLRTPVPIPRSWPGAADSIAIVLHHPSGRSETIALGQALYLGAASRRMQFGGTSEWHHAIHPLQSFDQAWMFPDRTIVVARVRPYRLEWRDPSGRWLRSTVVDDAAPELTASVKEWVTSHFARDDAGRPKFRPADFKRWPSQVPPFTREALIPGPDGKLYVRRTQISKRQMVDVFDRVAGRIETVLLPPSTRLLAVGARGWYLARVNRDDEEVLQRWVPAKPARQR